MAAPTESLLSLGHLTGTERNTFTKHREYSLKNSRVMLLQQRWQELKERELTAQQHNRQLLQQFERTQDTLREMLARNAAMKTIRMEYERYLEESAPRWQQQLKEKTQAAQRKRMEEYLRSCLKNTEQEQMTNPSADRPLLSQGLTNKPQKVSTPQEKNQSSHSDYNQDVSSHLPYVKSSWLTHTPSQSARFPIRGPSQPQDSSHVPPSYLPPSYIFPHPHQFQLQHLASTSTHHPPWPRQNTPGWGPTQPDYPCSWTTGAAGIPPGSEALWGQLYMEEPPPDRRVEAETSRAPSSKRERGGGSRSSCFSQELDIKPVRLSSGHAESSESDRDSSQASREKRKRREKRGKTRRTSSERCSSEESSTSPSADVVAGVTVVHGSESDTSSEKRSSGRTSTRSGGLAAGSPRMEEVANKRTRSKGGDSGSDKEKSRSTSEESVSQTEESRRGNVLNASDEKSHSWREEASESVSTTTENGVSEKDQQERSIGAEERGEEEEKHKDLGAVDDEEKENSQRNKEEEETDVEEDDESCARKNITEEEEETGAEDELEDQGDEEDSLKNEDDDNRTQGSATSQDEEYEGESEHDENKIQEEEGSVEEEDGEGEEEEQRSDEAGEERDSDDSIISPQENRLKKIQVVPEEAAEDDDHEQGSKTGSSDEDSNGLSEDDVEDLLAPPQLTQTQEKSLKVDDKPKATCDNVEIFQVELDHSTKTDHQSDSDEFDHFYD